MAKVTNLTLRHKLVYYLYVRNYTTDGTFRAVIPDLPRLQALGVDIIVFQSIFPTTQLVQSEDNEGNPFIIKDFDGVNPEYGSLEDFQALVDAIHDLGMQAVINLQLFHLARDSKLVSEHPEFFLQDEEGNFMSRMSVYDTSYDLDYTNPKLWDYLIERLEYWATLVDGFSANHSQLVRPEFWASARAEVEDVHPYFYWLAGVMPNRFMQEIRIGDIPYLTFSELSAYFDLIDNGAHMAWCQKFYKGDLSLENFAYFLNWSELNTPSTAVRLQSLEYIGHPRLAQSIQEPQMLANWTAFSFFQKGSAALMMGQEYGIDKPIDFRHKDAIDWTTKTDLSAVIATMAKIKKREECKNGYYVVQACPPNILLCSYHYYDRHLFASFKLRPDQETYHIPLNIPKGDYQSLYDGKTYHVDQDGIQVGDQPVIIEYQGEIEIPRFK